FAVASVYVFDHSIFDGLRKFRGLKGALELAISAMINKGIEVRGVRWDHGWVDIGRPWDFLRANAFLIDRVFQTRFKGGEGDPTRLYLQDKVLASGGRIVAPSYIEKNVTIGENAVIKESYVSSNVTIGENAVIKKSYVSSNAVVGTNSLVRSHSFIGEGVTVGFSNEIKNSVLMDQANVGHLSFIGDSILGRESQIGAGTITANVRFDKRNVRMDVERGEMDTGLQKFGAVIGDHAQLGINVSINPGVKISARAQVLPGAVLKHDVLISSRT
ncbi:MAG TPA: hypothetical protein VE177_08085, partial [Candidatus Binatus sp.]|nr:hypothetical protein [Candidatus Binatus sp.]